jgi:hypothetical protein
VRAAVAGRGDGLASIEDAGLRRKLQHIVNHYNAAARRPHRAWVIPLAGIVLHTPAEALGQLEFSTKRLGMRAVYVAGGGWPGDRAYDPFWQGAADGGIPVVVDAGGVDAAAVETVVGRFPRLCVARLGDGRWWVLTDDTTTRDEQPGLTASALTPRTIQDGLGALAAAIRTGR